MAPPITCHCGECKKCKRRLYMRAWTDRNRDRVRAIALESYHRNIEHERAKDRERGFRGDPVKSAIRSRTQRRFPIKQPCEVCGGKAERHHDDYGAPDDIRWLCRKHHGQEHRIYA